MTLLLLALLAVSPASSQQDGGSDEKSVLELMRDADKDIKQLAQDVRSGVIQPDHRAVTQIEQIGGAAPGVGQQLGGAAMAGEGATACAPQSTAKNAAQSSAQQWLGQSQDAAGAHEHASGTLEQTRQQIQKIDGELKRADERMRSAETILDEAGAMNAAPAQPQLLPVKGDVDGRWTRTDSQRRELKGKLQRLHRRWDKFKQALEGGSVKQFDEKAGQLVQSGSAFAGQANSAIGAALPCSGSSFGAPSSQVSQGGAKLSGGGDEGESGADQAVSAAQQGEQY